MSVHEDCVAHSGIEGKLTLIIWLMGLSFSALIFLVGLNVKMYVAINNDLTSLDKRVAANTMRLGDIDRRLEKLEEQH